MGHEVVFTDPSTVNQRGVFLGSALEPTEQQMIDDLVNWRDPQQYKHLIHDVFGRSLVLRSPIRPAGPYGGLQLIGAGGSPDILINGVLPVETKLRINPVDPSNHAERLESILQIHQIDQKGKVQSSYRPYAPMHGMDHSEAEARKAMTYALHNFLAHKERLGEIQPCVTPKFVADGQLIGKADPEGQPLRFQVYRVPLVSRFPGQLSYVGLEHGMDEGLKELNLCSFLAGLTLRTLHGINIGYKDSHAGNMSIFFIDEMPKLFITDLGSTFDFRGHPYPDRYRAFDVHMYLESVRRLLTGYFDLMEREGKFEGDRVDQGHEHMRHAVQGLTEGYFRPELLTTRDSKGLSDEETEAIVWQRSRQLGRGFARYYPRHQKFLEFFEGFYREFKAA